MVTHRQTQAVPRSRGKQGFSLVATILMLSLLMVLALGMTTLSTVSLRNSTRDRDISRARANARLALQIAIGELQQLAGPDRRVTSSSPEGDGSRPHLTGVWEGWKWDGAGSTPDWQSEKDGRFKGWLVSSARQGASRSLAFANEPAEGRTVRLVPSHGDANDAVEADLVELGGSRNRSKGAFAWAVFDESQKADISLPADDEDAADEPAGAMDRLAAAYEPGYAAVKAFDWKALASRRDERANLLSLGQSRLIGLKKEDVSFHDAGIGSFGLLTNAADGGFATDLSSLFSESSLPKEYANRFVYSGSDAPLAAPPVRFTGANPLPSPDPSWALLHSHYRSYEKLSAGDSPSLAVTADSVAARPDPKAGLSGDQLLRQPAFNSQQIAPVIAKAQFVFSLTFGVNQGTLTKMWGNGGARSSPASLRDNYITWLAIDPVITLWNPYNVPLQFSGAAIELHRIPMAFKLYKNGNPLTSTFTRLTDAHTAENFKDRQNRYYVLKLLPEKGRTTLLMQPGEHIVFTGQEWTLHGGHSYNKYGKDSKGKEYGLVMRPGFNPPAGLDSSPDIGGITTQNLFVNPDGTTSGKDYGKNVRTVAVKGGDRIEVEVKPERAGADSIGELGGREVTGFLKYYVGSPGSDSKWQNRRLVGGIELDYGDKEKEYLPEFKRNQLSAIVVNPAIPKTAPGNVDLNDEDAGADAALRWKEPFLIATFQQKTERDSKFPSRSWINNGPGNLYAAAGIDQKESFEHQQYEFKWEPMTDWPPDSPTIEISNDRNRGYGGSGIYAQTGTEFAALTSLPLAPAHSLGQFSHAPLNAGGQLPLVTRPFANSFAPALIAADKVREQADSRTYLDHSFFANNALLDGYFLSTAADHPANFGRAALSRKQIIEEFFSGKQKLPNRRFEPHLGHESPREISERLLKDEESYRNIAANLLVRGSFNVNSTSVAAWQALLASNFNGAVPMADGSVSKAEGVPVSRNLPSIGNDASSGSMVADQEKWTGHRRLSADQIESLAEAIVKQIRERGPFQSLAEFVNRRPGGKGESSLSGVIQTAIDESGINEPLLDPESRVTIATGANTQAGSGNAADGAPGIITQADLLTPLLPQLTVRGDTFVIRACGETVDSEGRRIRAWCEATVQRKPEFVDPADSPTATPKSSVNQIFGRRFEIVSFRWLLPSEV
jgi:hypothetical protein